MAVMDIIIRAKDQASEVVERMSERGSKAAQILEQNWVKVGAAGAAAGVGLEALARKQAPMTEQTRRLAASLGMTEQEVRSLAAGMSDATFPLDSALNLMETGRRVGLQSAEQLERFARTWDMVGDASGESADQLADAGVALRTMGIAAGQESEALAAFGFLLEHTTSGVGDFLGIIERVGLDLNAMGLDINDTAALLGILEREFGLSGAAARRGLMQAINEADGSLDAMLGTLGISEGQLAAYRQQVEESGDVVQRNAEIHVGTRTVLEQFQARMEAVIFQYGHMIQAASNLVPILMSMGPLIKGLTSGTQIYTAATRIATVAARGFGVAMRVATGPVGLIITAIGAAVAIGWYLYKNWDQVVEVVRGLWDRFQTWFLGLWDTIWRGVQQAVDWMKNMFLNFHPLGLVIKHWEPLKKFFANLWDGIKGIFRSSINGIIGFANSMIAGVERMVNGIGSAINRIPRFTTPDWLGGALGGKTFGLPTIPEISLPRIPVLHDGGLFRAPTPGGEGLALLRDREMVLRPDQAAGVHIDMRGLFDGANIVIRDQDDARQLAVEIHGLLRTRARAAGVTL